MFGPMLGLITAVVATIGALMIAVFGPIKRLRLPVESVPGMSRGLLNMVLFAPFLVCFLLIDTSLAKPALACSLVALALGYLCYEKYGGQLTEYGYTRPRPWSLLGLFKRIRDDTVIGGRELTSQAAARKRQTGKSEQELLAEAEYKPDEIWTRRSRAAEQKKLERWYYGFMLCALLTVALAALAGQTILSGEAPLAQAKRVWSKAMAD